MDFIYFLVHARKCGFVLFYSFIDPNFLDQFCSFVFIKLTLGLFLLQYTYKRRATMIAKSKLQPLPSQVHAQGSLSVPGPLNPTTTFVQSNSNPQTAPGTAVPITNSSVPPVSASTVPATPITRGRSSSQITHGSRRQSISHTRNAASAGVPASGTLPGSSSTKLSSLPTSIYIPALMEAATICRHMELVAVALEFQQG